MRHRLSRLDILELALEGAYSRRGNAQNLEPEEWENLDRDVEELKERISKAREKANREQD